MHTDPAPPPIMRQTMTELEAHPRHGGRITVLPANENARGETADLIIGDEACFIQPDEALRRQMWSNGSSVVSAS